MLQVSEDFLLRAPALQDHASVETLPRNPAFDLGSERAAADDRQQEPDAARFQQRSGVNQKKRGLLMVQWGYADQAR